MIHTYTQQKAQGVTNSKGLHDDTNSADFRSHGAVNQVHDGKSFIARLKAFYSHINDAVSGFYIVRGIGIDSLILAVSIVIYLIWRAAA